MYLDLNPNLRISDFDGGQASEQLLCELSATDGNITARYLIPTDLMELLELFDGSRETTEALKDHLNRHPEPHSLPELEALVFRFCVPTGLLIDPTARHEPIASPHERSAYLSLKTSLIPASVVSRLAAPLTWLFAGPALVAFLSVFVLTQIIFFAFLFPRYHFNLNDISGFDFLKVAAVAIAIGLAHELGHATALSKYGPRGARIGLGLYLIWPVFFTDLSAAWRLNRTERAIVDLGGIYFQSICLSVIMLLLLAGTGRPFLEYCFFVNTLSMVSSLNPCLRMDGYWVVADLLGIPDLRKQSVAVIKRFVYRIFRINAFFPSVRLNRKTTIFLCVYTAAATGFFVYLLAIISYQLVFKVLPGFPKGAIALLQAVSTHAVYHGPALLNMSIGMLWKTLALLGLCVFLYRTFRGLYELVCQVTRGKLQIRSSPVIR